MSVVDSETTHYVRASELARRYGVSAATVRAWARQGRIPAVRATAKTLRFDPIAVANALGARSVVK